LLEALTFDFWGTLYEDRSKRNERLYVLQDVLAREGQPRSLDELEAASKSAWSLWERVWLQEHRPLPIERWLEEMMAFLKAELPGDVLKALHEPMEEIYLNRGRAPEPIAGVLDVLPRLARRYRLGLISDTGLTPGRVLRELMRRDEVLAYFRVVTFSDEIGVTKPEPEPFVHTLKMLGAPADAAAHIGDLPETDLVGAHAAGMRAILFLGKSHAILFLGKSHREDGLSQADAAFYDYGELEGLLEDLS